MFYNSFQSNDYSNYSSLLSLHEEEDNFSNDIIPEGPNQFGTTDNFMENIDNESKSNLESLNCFENSIIKEPTFDDIMAPIKSNEDKESIFLGHKRYSPSLNEFYLDDCLGQDKSDIEIKSSLKGTSDESTEKIIEKKINFNCKSDTPKTEYRNDYYIKKLKKDIFSNFARNKINQCLKDNQFPKKTKIYKPNCAAFTSIANLNKNLSFLPMKLKEVFSLNDNKEGNLQEKNKELFDKIFETKKIKNPESFERLKKLLNLTVEEIIKDYYYSPEFSDFCKKEEIKNYDKEFFKEKKFSMLKDYGFLKLLRAQY